MHYPNAPLICSAWEVSPQLALRRPPKRLPLLSVLRQCTAAIGCTPRKAPQGDESWWLQVGPLLAILDPVTEAIAAGALPAIQTSSAALEVSDRCSTPVHQSQVLQPRAAPPPLVRPLGLDTPPDVPAELLSLLHCGAAWPATMEEPYSTVCTSAAQGLLPCPRPEPLVGKPCDVGLLHHTSARAPLLSHEDLGLAPSSSSNNLLRQIQELPTPLELLQQFTRSSSIQSADSTHTHIGVEAAEGTGNCCDRQR